jgi:hypothetical protein
MSHGKLRQIITLTRQKKFAKSIVTIGKLKGDRKSSSLVLLSENH